MREERERVERERRRELEIIDRKIMEIEQERIEQERIELERRERERMELEKERRELERRERERRERERRERERRERERREREKEIAISGEMEVVRGIKRRTGTFVQNNFFESLFGDYIEIETKDQQFHYIKCEDIREIPVGSKCTDTRNGLDVIILEPTRFMNLSDNEVLVLCKGKLRILRKNILKEVK